MEFESAVERGKDPQFFEVTEKELVEYGWEPYPRSDGHVFTVVVRQGTNLEKAFAEGRGIYAKHQMKAVSGRELLRGSHIDYLKKGKLQEQDIMSTEYNTSIGHHDFIVLNRITNQPTTI